MTRLSRVGPIVLAAVLGGCSVAKSPVAAAPADDEMREEVGPASVEYVSDEAPFRIRIEQGRTPVIQHGDHGHRLLLVPLDKGVLTVIYQPREDRGPISLETMDEYAAQLLAEGEFVVQAGPISVSVPGATAARHLEFDHQSQLRGEMLVAARPTWAFAVWVAVQPDSPWSGHVHEIIASFELTDVAPAALPRNSVAPDGS